ncbi:hypothetical protein PVAP13_2NG458215 [Panicum virgatum]|uniref:Uncharacterized protein n=1 Tax=Panicum virgatum TaxID=38727 RepID=A0A8T0VPA5_PANVG|nr:hypothetical protein PVAP13_2NG458215 [Panicum virgatum]
MRAPPPLHGRLSLWHPRSFAGNDYNHWLTEYEKDVEKKHMLAMHMFTISPVLWFTLISTQA